MTTHTHTHTIVKRRKHLQSFSMVRRLPSEDGAFVSWTTRLDRTSQSSWSNFLVVAPSSAGVPCCPIFLGNNATDLLNLAGSSLSIILPVGTAVGAATSPPTESVKHQSGRFCLQLMISCSTTFMGATDHRHM